MGTYVSGEQSRTFQVQYRGVEAGLLMSQLVGWVVTVEIFCIFPSIFHNNTMYWFT